jgi:RNA polymerase sigma-70 factor (ECF subfamily)
MSAQKKEIEQLYIGCYHRLLSVARAMLKDDEDASDVVSDVFARLAEGMLTLPEERTENYLLVIVRNQCIDRIRKMTVRERIERRLSLSETDQTAMDNDRERVREMIDYAERHFPRQTWRVFQLRFDDGLLYREIAERLGISEVAVYKHLAEALKKLKEKFNPTRR